MKHAPRGQKPLEGGQGILTLHAEHAHFVRVRHGDVEDDLVAGREVLRAFGPQDHLGHVLQVCGQRQEEAGTERTALGCRGRRCRGLDEGTWEVPTSSYPRDVRNNTTDLRHCCTSHVKVVKKVNPKRSPLKDFFFYFFNCVPI